jgi:ATP-dependent helicase HrpB
MIPLPIDSVLPELLAAVAKSRAAVLVAPPGAGKTTRVPPALLAAGLLAGEHPNLVMLQPRRVAARAAASRIAEENGWQLGDQVGYQIRFERVMRNTTRLRVLTEGILTRQLLDDPFLDGIGAVVLDEFHERSINTDMAISLLREVRQSVRDDLILLVMSATLHAGPVSEFLGGCPIIHSPGKMFEVAIDYRPPSGRPLEEHAAAEIEKILALPPADSGDVLVFLPGANEIFRTQQRLPSDPDLILPLHGSLPFEQQVRALQPAARRKVILATNIAETSLTIPGVRTVIDSGLARQADYDAQRGLDQLHLTRISRASAEQRTGRAGRTAPGRCIRLWTAKEQAEMEPFDAPEIHRVDLSPTVLALHAWGKTEVRKLAFFDPPPEASLLAAERLLWMLGALNAEMGGKITDIGRRMLSLPIHPRLARLLIAAADAGLADEGAAVAALISERSDRPTVVSDLHDRQVLRLKEDLLRLVRRTGKPTHHAAGEADLQKLILLAFPDRVCRRRGGDPAAAVMIGGGGVRFARETSISAEFFVAVDVRQDDRARNREALVRVASPIEPAWLAECFPGSVQRKQTVRFDEARGRAVGITQNVYLDLILSEETDAAVKGDDASAALLAAVLPNAAEYFAADESAAALLARIDFLRKWMPEQPWPVFDAALLAEVLTEACAGLRGIDDLKRRPLGEFLSRRLEYPLNRLLDQHAPAAMQLPGGKSAKLRYDPGRPPVLAVRLQELFGWRDTPRVAAGRVAVLLEILGPNYRPVQITDDLAGFWANTYFQVRKDLRRRYPKHAWPDDPLTARPPVRK